VTRAPGKNESTCAVVPGVDEFPASLQLFAYKVRIPSVVVVFTRNVASVGINSSFRVPAVPPYSDIFCVICICTP